MDKSFLLKNITDTVTFEKLELFVKDYFNTFKNENPLLSDFNFVNAALFINSQNSKAAIRILVKNENKSYLTDENLKPVLSDYDSITPMFKNDIIPAFAKNEFSVSPPLNSDIPFFSSYPANTASHLLALYSPLDILSSLYLVKISDSYGIANRDGRMIVQPFYEEITVLPLMQNLLCNKPFERNAFLFACVKDESRINKIDVYDTFGNLLYCNIADISIGDNTVKFSAIPEKSPLKLYPVSLKATNICIKKAKTENGDMGDSNIVNYIIPADEFLGNPKQDCPFKPNDTPCFAPEWVHIPNRIKLCHIKESLLKMSIPFAKKLNKNVKEIMLSIPLWDSYKKTEIPLPSLTAESSISDIEGISIRTHNILLRAGYKTVIDIINLNIDDIRSKPGFGKRVEDELNLLKYRLSLRLKPN